VLAAGAPTAQRVLRRRRRASSRSVPRATANAEIATGEIEVNAAIELTVLGDPAAPLPFQLDEP
jgi:aspartyl-tRNA synthetase